MTTERALAKELRELEAKLERTKRANFDLEPVFTYYRRLRTLPRAALVERFGQHPHVGDIRGRGLFRGVELVADRETKATFDPKLRVHAQLKKAAFEAGLICYPMGGTIDGSRGDHVLLAPPFIVDARDIEEIVDRLGAAVDAVLEGAAG